MKNNNRSTIDAGYNAGYDGNLYSMVKTLAPDSEGQRAVQAARRLKRIRILTVSIVICLVAVVSAVFAIYSSTDWFKAKTPQPSDVDVVTPTRVTVVNRNAFAEAQRTGDFSALSGGADASLWVQPFLIGYRLIAEDDEIVKIAGGKIYGWAPGFTKVRVETSDGQFVDEFTVEVLDENGRLYYDVKFYAEQGASGDPLATLRVISGRAITQMQLSLPAFPAKAGYTPKFWTVDGKRFYDSDPITSDINVYVSWDPRIVSFLSSFDGNLDNAAYKADYEADISDYIDKTSGSGSFTYSAANLPSGLTLNPATGEISGRPQAAGTYVFTVTATDNAQTVQDRQNTKATKEFRLNVAKRVADIVFENKMFIYDGTYQTIAATITNIAEGDQGLVTPVINYINGTAQGVRNVGNYTAKVTALTGARADNYVLATQKTRDFSVYPRIAEISFTSGAVFTYDGTPKYAAARVVNLVPGDTCDVNISYDKDESGRVNVTGPEGIIATVDALSNPNYTLPNNAVTQRITIVPAVVFITVNVGQSKVYGSDDPLKFACSVSTDVEADLDAWETVAPLGIRRAAGENAGSYSYYFDASLIPASGQVADLLNNYTIEFRNPTDARFEITKRPVSLVGVVERGYNGGTDLGDAIYTFEAFNAESGSGLKSPDTLVLAGSYENKAVGEGKTLVNLSLPAGLASNDNYELITKTYTNGKITVRNITSVSNFIGIGKEYDGTTNAQVDISAIALDGVLFGDNISISYNAAFDSKNVGSRTISITDIVITGEDKDNYRLLNNTATATASIYTRKISAVIGITVAGKTYDRSINVPASNIDTSMAKFGKFVNGAFVNLLVSGDTLNVTSIAARYEDALYGLTKSVIITDIAIGGNDNYKLAPECEFGEIYSSIYKKDLAISASDTSKVYNGKADIIVSNYTITGVILGDEVFFDGSYASVNVAETVDLSFSLYGDDSANYRINTAPATGSINPRPVTVSGVFGKEYDATVNLVSALTINNLVAGDEADVAVTGDYSTANAGAVTLNLSLTGAKAANYSLTNNAIAATIAQKVITISVDGLGLTKVYDGSAFVKPVTADMVYGLVEGDTFMGTISTSDKYVADAKAIALDGFKVLDNGADVTANYSFAGVSGTVAITTKEVTIEGDFDKTYDATKAVKVAGLTIAGKVASDDLYVSGEYALADFGTRAITFEIDGADKGNYTLVGSYSGYISKKTITISHSFTKVYDGNVYTVTVDREMVSGLISGRDYAITATLTSGDKNVVRNGNVGLPKPLTLQGGIVITDGWVDVTHNFEVIIDATVTINPAPLVLTQANLEAQDKDYDGTTTATVAITGNPQGYIAPDELEIDGIIANFANAYAAERKTVTVSGTNLVLGGADKDNYILNYTGAGFTTKANIRKRPITIVGNLDKTYDGNDNVDVSVLSVQNAVAADIGSIVFTGKYDSAGASPQFKTITFTPGNDIVSKNYIISGTYYGKINKRLLNVIHAEQKPYDGTTAIDATLDPAGIVSGDEVFIVGGCGYFTDKYVAQNKAVSFTLGGGQKDNYYVQDSTAHIVRASITIDLDAARGKVYDATLYTGNITEGMLSGLAPSDYLKSGIFESNSIHAGSVDLFYKNVAFADRDTDTDTTGCYIINIINNTATINPREITVETETVADKVYDGTKNVGVSLNYTVSGMDKEDESLLRVVVSGAELPNKDVGTYTFDVGFAFEGAHADNYIATNVGAMVEVTVKVVKKPVQVIAAGGYTLTQALTKPYDKTEAVADLNKLGLQGTIAGD
ncbi:MAG TPA: YDG domain-containing protein, partial [Clostridia bacterium]|nr:YDG domain-containing protein [Clostridia bacterium]